MNTVPLVPSDILHAPSETVPVPTAAAEKQTAYLNEAVGKDKLSAYTANIAFAGFTAPKLLWLKENEPDNFNAIAKIMLPKDYLCYLFTGEHATDYSDAAGTLLLDVENMRSLCG